MQSQCPTLIALRFQLLTRWVLTISLLAVLFQAAPAAILQPYNTETATTGPMPTADVVAKSILPPGFHLSVFAAEPDVRQPIAMTTDPRGRLWVAENDTYSERVINYHEQLRDRIVIFEDSDHDGQFDKRIVFWEDAQRLTSVEVGLGGVWALALPNLVFIPDANGDDIPDGPPQVVLDGFESDQGRHTIANGLRWGPDGWLYGRHGILSTSPIGAPGTPQEDRVSMNVGIWRYHPTRRVTEIVTQGTTNPWGMDWDEHGELFFINTVIGHLWHVIPGAHYRRMFGEDPTPHVYEIIEQTADHVHWNTNENWADVRKGVTDVTSAAGGGHAHTGLLIYQGGQWPAEWNNRMLTINFHGRRLNVDQLDRAGSGFVGRHRPDAFFFADPWFRGIDLIAAPDGGVFVSDWSDAGECHDHDGIHRTSGRIYKLTHGETKRESLPNLATFTDLALAQLQTSPNDWQARQARRVLATRAHRGDTLHVGRNALRQMAMESQSETTRLRALWALHVSGGVEAELLQQKLTGTEHERAWAIRLWEDSRHTRPALAQLFNRMVQEDFPGMAQSGSSALVRVTLASLLQKLSLPQRPALAEALLSHAEDATDHNIPLMLWYGIEPLAQTNASFMNLIAQARLPRVQRLGARRLAEDIDTLPEPVDHLLQAIVRHPDLASRQAVLDGLAEGFAGRRKVNQPPSWKATATRLSQGADETLTSRIRDLSALFGDGRAMDEIQEIALNQSADLPLRRTALQSLIDARADGLREVCQQLLPVRDLTGTAARGLALFEDPALADLLIAEWPHLYGHERAPVMNALLSRSTWISKLLDAMGDGRLRHADLGVSQARQIRDFKDAALTQRLSDVWGTIQDTDESTRQQALQRWKQTLTPAALSRGDLKHGQQIFSVTCGACHKLYGQGGTLSPDLTGAGRQNIDYLLENILFPNAVVPAEYRQTTMTLKDGRVLSGIVTSRSPQTIVLTMIGETTTLSRTDIEEEEISTLSMMPEGLLDALTTQQALDLIAFLMSTAPPL